MEKNEVFEQVKAMVVEKLDLDADEVKMESSFQDDLGADSLDIMELIDDLENEFDMEIAEEDLEKIRTVGDAVTYILKLTS